MQHFAGLDVSIKETSICIVDDHGAIVRDLKVELSPGRPAAGAGRRDLLFQAGWFRGRAVVPVALQRTC